MKRIRIATLVGGGVAVIVSLFLHYVVNTSVGQLTTRYPVVITILAVAAIELAVVSLPVKTSLLLAVATAASAFILGEAFPLGDPSYHYQLGFWLAVGGSAIMILGGIVAIAASVKESQRRRAPEAAAFAAATGEWRALPSATEPPLQSWRTQPRRRALRATGPIRLLARRPERRQRSRQTLWPLPQPPSCRQPAGTPIPRAPGGSGIGPGRHGRRTFGAKNV